MDVLNKRHIIEYLLDARDKGCAVFSSSHELSELSGICDSIYYLSKEGKLSVTNEEGSRDIKKIQIVVKDELPSDIKDKSVIISHIGRVYTILADIDDESLTSLLNKDQVIQYDSLDIRLEDYFYLEEGGHNDWYKKII